MFWSWTNSSWWSCTILISLESSNCFRGSCWSDITGPTQYDEPKRENVANITCTETRRETICDASSRCLRFFRRGGEAVTCGISWGEIFTNSPRKRCRWGCRKRGLVYSEGSIRSLVCLNPPRTRVGAAGATPSADRTAQARQHFSSPFYTTPVYVAGETPARGLNRSCIIHRAHGFSDRSWEWWRHKVRHECWIFRKVNEGVFRILNVLINNEGNLLHFFFRFLSLFPSKRIKNWLNFRLAKKFVNNTFG